MWIVLGCGFPPKIWIDLGFGFSSKIWDSCGIIIHPKSLVRPQKMFLGSRSPNKVCTLSLWLKERVFFSCFSGFLWPKGSLIFPKTSLSKGGSQRTSLTKGGSNFFGKRKWLCLSHAQNQAQEQKEGRRELQGQTKWQWHSVREEEGAVQNQSPQQRTQQHVSRRQKCAEEQVWQEVGETPHPRRDRCHVGREW